MFDLVDVRSVVGHIFILFFVALIVVRIMGNRTVGQLSPFDFVIMVGIGDIIVAASMDKNQTLYNGIAALVMLLVLQQMLSYLALKNTTLRKWFEGTPVVLVQDGRIIRENFSKTYFNYDDLRQELHRQGMDMSNLKDIKLARLESCGMFSVVKKPEKEPLTREDFEKYILDMQENPLGLLGQKWAKVERFMDDVAILAEHIRRQSVQADSGGSTVESREQLQ